MTVSDDRPILVTGGTGCIGFELVQSTPAERPICLLVRPSGEESAADRVSRIFPDRNLQVVEGDLKAPDLGLAAGERRRLIQRIGGVVHLAARTDFKSTSVDAYLGPNVTAAENVGRLALDAGVPMLHASTAYVAGDLVGTLLETDLARGQGFNAAYEHSKWLAEKRLLELAGRGLRLSRLRLGVVVPDSPPPGSSSPGPGPLVYLKLLSNLPSNSTEVRVLRIPFDPDAALNVVPGSWVVRVIHALLDRDPATWAPCYHVTAANPLSMTDLQTALEHATPSVRLMPAPSGGLDDPDAIERLVQKRCAMYRPYQFMRTRWDRSRLERDLPELADDGASPSWLQKVFQRHLEAWRRRSDRPQPDSDVRQVQAYFSDHLESRKGLVLIPGLKTLSAVFSIQVLEVGVWRIRIDAGRLVEVEPVTTPCELGYELDTASFLRIVRGEVAPQSLFFAQAIRIRGPAKHALSLAGALEEFFCHYPFKPSNEGLQENRETVKGKSS